MTDVLVIGAGPAGVLAALRAADLGAQTALVTSGAFGGMAANDGPVPVRTLAHAGRLMREARQLGQYGVKVSEPVLDYSRLLARVREVVNEVCTRSSLRQQIDAYGVTVHEQAGAARFVDSHTIETKGGLRLEADKIIICTGGVNRRLPIAGFELTSTHSDAWRLTSVPPSMLVIGAGATGVQVASIFNALGSRVQLFEAGPRILATEDESVSAEAAAVFRESGMVVRENFGTIDSFEKTDTGVRMNFSKDGQQFSTEAALAVVAIGWMADTTGLNLAAAGVELNQRKFVKVDDYLRTSAHPYFRGRRYYWADDACPPSAARRLRSGYKRRAGPEGKTFAREGGGSNWKFHRARICSGWPYRSKGPSNKRCSDRDSELRFNDAYDH